MLLSLAASDPALTRRDRAIAAQCAVQLGEIENAAEELSQLTRSGRGLPNRVAALASLSDLYLQLGRPEEAREAARSAWIADASPSEGALARRLEERAMPSTADRIDRGEQLIRARRFEMAVEELEAIPGVAGVRGIPTVYRDLFGGEDPEALADSLACLLKTREDRVDLGAADLDRLVARAV